LLDLGRRQELGRLPPGLRRRDPAPQLLQPLRRPRELEPAALREDAELLVLEDAVLGELRHLLRVVDREDEVRRMAGRAAGVRQRPLLEQDDVAPALLRQVVDDAVADDPGADNDDAGLIRYFAHVRALLDI